MTEFGLPYTWITGYVSPPALYVGLTVGLEPWPRNLEASVLSNIPSTTAIVQFLDTAKVVFDSQLIRAEPIPSLGAGNQFLEPGESD